jgi:hypothetical protein
LSYCATISSHLRLDRLQNATLILKKDVSKNVDCGVSERKSLQPHPYPFPKCPHVLLRKEPFIRQFETADSDIGVRLNGIAQIVRSLRPPVLHPAAMLADFIAYDEKYEGGDLGSASAYRDASSFTSEGTKSDECKMRDTYTDI